MSKRQDIQKLHPSQRTFPRCNYRKGYTDIPSDSRCPRYPPHLRRQTRHEIFAATGSRHLVHGDDEAVEDRPRARDGADFLQTHGHERQRVLLLLLFVLPTRLRSIPWVSVHKKNDRRVDPPPPHDVNKRARVRCFRPQVTRKNARRERIASLRRTRTT